MKKSAFALALLLAFSLLDAIFLVGNGEMGRPVSVLCENETSVFVSTPESRTLELLLDESSQAEFVPDAAGPYTVQCGNQTRAFSVQQQSQAAKVDGNGMEAASAIVLFSIIAFISLMAIASFFIAKSYLFGGPRFSKAVDGNIARLHLLAGERMENVDISDPVCIGCRGKEFSIPALGAGSEWRCEYAIPSQKNALPASLSARVSGKEVSMLSELYIGKEEARVRPGPAHGQPERARKKLPKCGA